MKRATASILIAVVLSTAASAEYLKSFRLKIGEQTVEIDPGETAEITLPDGSKAPVTLERNEFATYAGAAFSFNYPTSLNVTRSDLGDGIVQHLMASALGTVVIVQEYASMNPASLDRLMMEELTKETVQAGGKATEEPTERTLSSGEVLKGLKSTIVFGDNTVRYEVLAFGDGDSGIITATIIDEENVENEGGALTTFWDTLALK